MATVIERIYKLTADASPAVRNLNGLVNQTRRADNALRDTNATYQKSSKAGKQFGYQVQNMSYQMADFAVQVRGGVAPMRAFAQQAPQMLAGFGPFGAVLGVAAAVLPAFVVGLNNSKKSMRTTSEVLDDLNDSMSAYGSALTEYIKTGDAFARVQLRMAESIRQVDLKEAVEALTPKETSGFAAFWQLTVESFKESSREAVDAASDLADKAGGYIRDFLGTVSPEMKAAWDNLLAIQKAKADLEKSFSKQAADVLGATQLPDQSNFEFALQQYYELVEVAEAARKSLGTVPPEVQKALDALKSGLDPLRALNQEAQQLIKNNGLTGAFIEWSDGMEKFKRSLDEGAISAEQFKAVSAILLKDLQQNAGTQLNKIADEVDKIGFALSDTLVQGLETGKFAFDDFAKSVLRSLAQVVLNDIFQDFFSLISGSIRSTITPGDAAAVRPKTGRAGVGALTAPAAKENVVGVLKAPTYGFGGKSKALGDKPTINVYNNASNNTEVTVNTTNNGETIDVMIERKVRGMVASGALDAPMRSSYGIARRAF